MSETLDSAYGVDWGKPGGNRTVGVQLRQVWRKVNSGVMVGYNLAPLSDFRVHAYATLGFGDGSETHRKLVNRLRYRRGHVKHERKVLGKWGLWFETDLFEQAKSTFVAIYGSNPVDYNKMPRGLIECSLP